LEDLRSGSASPFFAGAAETVITPPVGAPLLGTIQRSTGVHDDLYARALVLSDGKERVAIVCLDLIGMDFALADEIRGAIRRRTGITAALLNCSHTHSSPFTIPWSVLGGRWLAGPGQSWRNGLAPRIAELVFQAAAASAEAALRVGRAPVQVGVNRRLPSAQGVVMKPNPDGAVVPWVDVLRVDRTDGTPLAVLFSHAAHAVIIHGASRLISADYPGFAARKLRERFGGEVITLFGQGCGANINGEPLRGGLAEAQRIGGVLAEAAFQAADNSQPLPPGKLQLTSAHGELLLRPLPTSEECSRALSEAEHRLAQVIGQTSFSDEQLWDLQDRFEIDASKSAADDVQPMERQPWWLMDNVLCLRDLLGKIERGDQRPLRFDAHLLRVGESWSLLAAAHELFAEYQLWFDRHGPARHKMMLAYTNGCESYLPTDAVLTSGAGYEAATYPSLAGAAFKYHHRRALQPGAEQQVLKMFRSLWP
jgi:hypothetical protein